MHTVLLGPRASGKTDLGRALAAVSGRPFLDLDAETLARFPCASITDVFRRYGEGAFRAAEAAALAEAIETDPAAVIATGGGTPTVPTAAAVLRRARAMGRARTVYLDVPVPALVARLTAGAGDRPGLTRDDPVAEVEVIVRERTPIYRAAADIVLSVLEGEIFDETVMRLIAVLE